MTRKQKKMLIRILVASAMMLLLIPVPAEGVLRFLLYMIPYFVIGYDILIKAGKGVLNRQPFDECFLMAVATIGAIVIALSRSGDYTEAIAVMLFYQIGEWFQSYAVGRSRRNISELMDIRPDIAYIETENGVEEIDPDEVEIGSVLVVRPGDKVPIDGTVLEGESALDTAALTGESVPREVTAGSEALSGCINLSGLLRIRTTREFGESTVSKILELVENASSRKSRSEAFITRFARIYTPAVCCSALALAILPPAVRALFLGLAPAWSEWIYRALTFLVISCPCALVISIPLSYFASIGGASSRGILVKGSNYLEMLAKVRCVVLDKTGTLTCGVFAVRRIYNNTVPEEMLIEYAALAESGSTHPIAASLLRGCKTQPDFDRVQNIREFGGSGVIASVDGREVAVGNTRLLGRVGAKVPALTCEGTAVHVALDGVYAGTIEVSDTLKPGSTEAITLLKAAGVSRIVMLTGDNRAAAARAAEELGISEFYAELLPGDKVTRVEQLLGKGVKVAFAGDGINDAPVLSRADVGIAMGAIGSDAAIEAADIVLMDDDPRKIASAICIAKKCLQIVYQNMFFAIGIKLLCLVLGAIGLANMWLAIFADVGVMVLAVLNAIRALFLKNI